MKYWTTLGFIIAGLSFVLYFQSLEHQATERAMSSAELQDYRAVPAGKPAPRASANPPALTFGGYPCAGDCSDDKAGYQWAEQNGITDPDGCTGDTGAFIEGCRVYAQRQTTSSAVY